MCGNDFNLGFKSQIIEYRASGATGFRILGIGDEGLNSRFRGLGFSIGVYKLRLWVKD